VSERKPKEPLETFVERQIREAQEEGAFDHLSCAGKPLPFHGGDLEEGWWIKEKLKRERLSVLPDSLEIRREAERLLDALPSIGSERILRERVETLNARIRRLNATNVAGPPTTVSAMDVEAVVLRWRRARGSR
jgi:hypothetical protein